MSRTRVRTPSIRRSVGMTLVSVVIASSLLPATSVQAQHGPGSVVEQQWELLAETRVGLLGTTTIPIHRGVLPGGTTKFDPQPTATFEIVAKLSAGLGFWDVTLRDAAGGEIAMMTLSQSSSEYQIYSAPLSWPATDMAIADIRAFREFGGTRILDIKKAYVRVTQSGTVTKTVSRMPMATRQAGITGGWQDLADPILYRHQAAEFDPAPVVHLRTTGKTNDPCGVLEARLVDSSGSPVPGVEETWNQGTEWTSNVGFEAVEMEDGETYRVQVRTNISGLCFAVIIAELLSADLIFEQSTDNPHGIGATVALYPSVSSSVDISSDDTNLDFLIENPDNSVLLATASYTASIRRTDGSAGAGLELIDRSDPSSPMAAVAAEDPSSYVYLKGDIPSLPSDPNAVLDARTDLPAGTAGRVSQSVVRIAMLLREIVPPEVIDLVPGQLGNTAYGSQVVAAKIADVDSGVDGSSAALELKDDTLGSNALNIPAQFDPTTGWLRSISPQPLITGHAYTVSLSVQDAVGNLLEYGWAFKAISEPVFEQGLAYMDQVGRETGNPGSSPGTREWLFKPGLDIEPRSASFADGSLHFGWGTVASTVGVGDARILVTSDGVETEAAVLPYPIGDTRTVYEMLPYTDSLEPLTATTVGPSWVMLPDLTLDLPEETDSARIVLSDGVVTSTVAGVCADPMAGSTGCATDPLHFYMTSSMADKIPDPTEGGQPIVGGDFIGVAKAQLAPEVDLLDGVTYRIARPFENRACYDDMERGFPVCPLNDVLYPDDTPVVPPELFAEHCLEIIFCDGRTIADHGPYERQFYCVEWQRQNSSGNIVGRDRHWVDDWSKCQQTMSVQAFSDGTWPAGSSKELHRFRVLWQSEWGFADGTSDFLGLNFGTPNWESQWHKATSAELENASCPGCPAIAGSYSEGSLYSGLYPKQGFPTEANYGLYPGMLDTFQTCFKSKGGGSLNTTAGLVREPRLLYPDEPYDPQDNPTVYAHGVGSLDGWKQWQFIEDCPETGSEGWTEGIYLRPEVASMVMWVHLGVDCPCGTRQNGYLYATYEHMFSGWGVQNPDDVLFTFAFNYASNSSAQGLLCWTWINPYCNGWALVLAVVQTGAEHVRWTEQVEVTPARYRGAFTYKYEMPS